MEKAVILIDILKRYFDRLPIRAENRRIINLPNAITLLRIGILPVLFLVLLEPGEAMSLAIAILFILAALTDLLDGYVARRYNIVTRMGKLLDPIADKIIMSAALVLLIPVGRAQAWVVALMIMRDFAVDGLRSMAAAEGHVIEASRLGKYKTLCQIIAVSALIIHYPICGVDAATIGTVFLYVALVLSLWSGFDYLVKFYRTTLV
ncbi:MAG: CDP-diacylglycerol--glycerol-3-phosphate 3-phosphatidyltransferase [Pseudomonadota bacterium]|jgi:CDP-diacylglycerol--glycerol-3-phosphate 3-phosphatidyltransferase|nr:CDP-diacylglycerol--glycerol-3-phosphate 3-phosphatidyltransferase [Pseudomonadota bacterium]HNZ35419.1 CDP-diacylglycerol--glycerol-3-phosphate 3-phosphatidyltransferase [Syntrophales bacterium]HOF74745.1 CDP-diacylglycerol--glycerol-3-phosphate 3-phosphatidyltransferase [Syntrophales bacterium]HOH45591.1 CDP-diacylglycerol--glycerol-3-phosphate 3-phosphatidyltransferase [Syntrophales bacterium]HOR33248.1 CDP-diacylglycerol--glycerol-3-phosphate 3-phosphatidyltransferase [Syntrophales bacte